MPLAAAGDFWGRAGGCACKSIVFALGLNPQRYAESVPRTRLPASTPPRPAATGSVVVELHQSNMFHFLAEGSFWLWFAAGMVLSAVAGFSAISQGSFFKTSAGYIFQAFCLLGILALLVKMGWTYSILAALLCLLLFWTVLGFGGSIYRPR